MALSILGIHWQVRGVDIDLCQRSDVLRLLGLYNSSSLRFLVFVPSGRGRSFLEYWSWASLERHRVRMECSSRNASVIVTVQSSEWISEINLNAILTSFARKRTSVCRIRRLIVRRRGRVYVVLFIAKLASTRLLQLSVEASWSISKETLQFGQTWTSFLSWSYQRALDCCIRIPPVSEVNEILMGCRLLLITLKKKKFYLQCIYLSDGNEIDNTSIRKLLSLWTTRIIPEIF